MGVAQPPGVRSASWRGGAGTTTAQSDEPWTQLATRIPQDLHRQIKVHCITVGMTLMDFVTAALAEKLSQSSPTSEKVAKRYRKVRPSR